ncbi:GTPase Era [Mycobacterium tuberculosis]|nr:GTPase Era [Mycobacterium tuberculosis]
MMRRPITLAEQLDAEDAKLVVLARAAMARAEAGAGAAVRDVDGRTYAAAPVALSALELTGLQAAVAAAVSSGATGLQAAVLVAGSVDDPGIAAVRELARPLRSSSPIGQVTRYDAERAFTAEKSGKSLPVFTFGEETGMTEFHSGFVCLVGRPNTGKSTLTNALVGAKVAITSTRPQTTRHAIRGIVHSDDFQIILVDTPGLHRPRTLLGKRLNDLVRETYAAVDVIGLCIPADEAIGPGDRWIVEQLRSTGPANTTLVVIVTKIDKVPKEKVVAQLVAVSELVTNAAEIVPVSAMTGDRVDLLIDVLAAALPAGPAYYPDGELTDEPEEVLMAELIREAALQGVRDELPHSLAVVIDEVSPREGRDDLIDVHAALYVERDSQKGIVIGKGGARLREVGTAARSQIENLLGTKVYLDLRVKVAKNWQRDPKQLGRLGF